MVLRSPHLRWALVSPSALAKVLAVSLGAFICAARRAEIAF